MEGRDLEKNQKKGKTSKFSNLSKSVPKSIVWACFDWVFRRKKTRPSAPWRFKNNNRNRKKFKISKLSKNVPKSVQTSFEIVLGWFFRKKNFAQCTLEGRDLEEIQKIGNYFKFSIDQNCSQNVPNCFEHVWRCLFPKNSFCQCTLEDRGLAKTQKKWKKIVQFFKIVHKRPKSAQLWFDFLLSIFSTTKILLSAQ